MKYEISSSFFILHSSLNFAKQNAFGRAASLRSRRAIRSITFAHFMRSVVPLLSLSLVAPMVRHASRN
jgi:hypothetical protein